MLLHVIKGSIRGYHSPWVRGGGWACYGEGGTSLEGRGGNTVEYLGPQGASCVGAGLDRHREDDGGNSGAGVPCYGGVALWPRLLVWSGVLPHRRSHLWSGARGRADSPPCPVHFLSHDRE